MMSRFYVVRTLLLLPLFALGVVLMRLLGTTQPTHPALDAFTDCLIRDVPLCWNGITPNVTSRQETARTMDRLGYRYVTGNQESDSYLAPTDSHWCNVQMRYDRSSIARAIFLTCQSAHIAVGEIMTMMGTPPHLNVEDDFAILHYPERGLAYRVEVWASPYDVVENITLSQPYVLVNEAYSWRGFISKTNYCYSEPSIVGC
jgi:hypothetical protein